MQILIVDDDPGVREVLYSYLSDRGHRCTAVGNGTEAIEALDLVQFDLALVDLFLPELDGMEILRIVKRQKIDTEVIVITAYGSIPTAVEALNIGAYAYIRKPIDLFDLEHTINRAAELIELRKAYKILTRERVMRYNLENLIAVNPVTVRVKQRILEQRTQIEPTIISGESGTGKKFLANVIHFNGPMPGAQFIQFNPEDVVNWLGNIKFVHSNGLILEWMNFPHDFVSQGCGTVLFKRLNELDPSHQQKLSSLLVNWSVKVRERRERPLLRVIATLDALRSSDVYKGPIQKDLLNFFTSHFHLPPLRERREEILLIAEAFLNRITQQRGLRSFQLSQPVQEFMQMYDWPGNLLEMEQMMERVISTATTRIISIADLRRVQKDLPDTAEIKASALNDLLSRAEKQSLQRVFQSRGKKEGVEDPTKKPGD